MIEHNNRLYTIYIHWQVRKWEAIVIWRSGKPLIKLDDVPLTVLRLISYRIHIHKTLGKNQQLRLLRYKLLKEVQFRRHLKGTCNGLD